MKAVMSETAFLSDSVEQSAQQYFSYVFLSK